MFLKRYRKEVFRPECNSTFQSLHCIAHLDEDISEVLPYLNSALGGHRYCEDPPALTLKAHGRLITLHSHKIAINALEDEAQADKILEWLKQEINAVAIDLFDVTEVEHRIAQTRFALTLHSRALDQITVLSYGQPPVRRFPARGLLRRRG